MNEAVVANDGLRRSSPCAMPLLLVTLMALASVASTPVSAAEGKQNFCSTERCGLLIDGAYPDIVVGTLEHVGTDDDFRDLLSWTKAHGYWKALPTEPQAYSADAKLVTLRVPYSKGSRTVALFMDLQEYAAAPLRVGDLVRYIPHDLQHEAIAGDSDLQALHHGLTGCVATLCAKVDSACSAGFRPGAYRHDSGQQIDLLSGQIIPGGIRIDPISIRPALK